MLLTGEHAGATGGSADVWGTDRGRGTAGFALGNPPIGSGVTCDAVVALFADGNGFALDLIAGTAPTVLDLSTITSDDAASATRSRSRGRSCHNARCRPSVDRVVVGENAED